MLRWLFIAFFTLLGSAPGHAELRIAVAANFATTLEALVADYQANNAVEISLIRGSSGKLYAQIVQGAPFDAFFSADALRPQKLESRGLTLPGSRVTYALGSLVLWPAGPEPESALRAFEYSRFAIANPRLAPYGRAALEVLEKLALPAPMSRRLVKGESIAQAYQYVFSGNAEAGLLARSQMTAEDDFWVVPVHWYGPITQQRVILAHCQYCSEAEQFLLYLQSPAARQIISDAGYQLPPSG